jgi:hypothetical protein
MLSCTGEMVEKRGFAGVGVARQGDGDCGFHGSRRLDRGESRGSGAEYVAYSFKNGGCVGFFSRKKHLLNRDGFVKSQKTRITPS